MSDRFNVTELSVFRVIKRVCGVIKVHLVINLFSGVYRSTVNTGLGRPLIDRTTKKQVDDSGIFL